MYVNLRELFSNLLIKYISIEFSGCTCGKLNSFLCPPSDREKIVNLICWQKNKYTDLINIPVLTRKILAPMISPTVSMLFNNSLSEGTFLENS